MLILAVAGLVALAIVAFRALKQDVDGFREADKPALHWSAAQTEVELTRLISSIAKLTMQRDDAAVRRVNERFDILWSRTSDFRGGVLAEELLALDREIGAIPVLLNRIQASEPLIGRVADAPDEELVALIRDFTAAHSVFRRFVVHVQNIEQARYVNVRDRLHAGSQLTFLVWAAAIVLAALIVGIMLIETRRYQRMVLEFEELADQAQAADRAKSRFLTMMSHELRTPMNGVLGLMALAKQSGMTDAQVRLMEQAERAGVQMTGLLSDILDFSDLQTETLEIDATAFETHELGPAVIEMLAPAAKRNAVELHADHAPGLPDWVVGDFARLRQAIVHFCTYFIDIVGVRDLRLTMSYEDGTLVCAIGMDARDVGHPGWQPEAVFGRSEEDYGDFASDSIGPMIARGLINLMGGSVALDRPVHGRACLSVSLPAQIVQPRRDCVRVETTSATTSMLVRAALDVKRWRIWDPKLDRSRVAAVLVETAGVDAAKLTERLRNLHPGATLIALGDGQEHACFDAICRIPVDPDVLNGLLSGDRRDAALA